MVANEGYQECSIDDALVGYGKSCKGAADNITYWQYCGCSYGFVEVDGTNDPDDKALLDGNGNPIVNLDGNLVPYEARCAWDSKLYGGKCRFSQCNTDRRFFLKIPVNTVNTVRKPVAVVSVVCRYMTVIMMN